MATGVRGDQILRRYKNLQEIMLDKDLARLGDAYLNFTYSLALSQRLRRPMGAKADNQTLARALKRAGLREILPRRTDRHAQANAAEALIVYAWLQKVLDLEECLRILRMNENPIDALAELLQEIGKRLVQFMSEEKTVRNTSTRNNVPKALRVAHTIASGLAKSKEKI